MRQPHLLLIHGTFGSPHDWNDVVEQLQRRTNYTTEQITLPGHHGRPLDAQRPAFEQLVDAVEDAISEPCILVGYSLGGRAALHYLLRSRASAQIQAVVLEGAHPGITDMQERAQRAALDRTRAERILRDGLEDFLWDWYQAPLFALEGAGDAILQRLIHTRIQEQNQEDLARIIAESSPGVVPALWQHLPELALPLCYVHGAKDQKYAEVGRRIQQITPHTRVASITGAGHNAHHHNSEGFADALIRFVEQVRR